MSESISPLKTVCIIYVYHNRQIRNEQFVLLVLVYEIVLYQLISEFISKKIMTSWVLSLNFKQSIRKIKNTTENKHVPIATITRDIDAMEVAGGVSPHRIS